MLLQKQDWDKGGDSCRSSSSSSIAFSIVYRIPFRYQKTEKTTRKFTAVIASIVRFQCNFLKSLHMRSAFELFGLDIFDEHLLFTPKSNKHIYDGLYKSIFLRA